MAAYLKEDPQSIRQMFNSIARQYDKTNAILSFRMHKHWNRSLVRTAIVPAKPKILLDLCCGTGAIAFEYLKDIEHPLEVYMLDFSEKMLECAQINAESKHLQHHDINYLQADAQAIPLPPNSIDCATMAYGIRNIKDPAVSLRDVYRVLKPNGTFGILELTQPSNVLLRFGHGLYLRTVLPIVGKLVASNPEAYTYLCNSIHAFISPAKLAVLMQNAGFTNIQRHSLFGGIATIMTGQKAN